MKKKYSVLALFASIFLWFGFPNNPPNGNTGAPGEGTCANCHSLNGGTQDGMVDVTGMPTLITPNMAYVLTVTSTNPNGVAIVAGFQLTILNGLNQMAGVLSLPSTGSALETSSGRQYWEHNMPSPYPMSHMVSWTATWTAPSMPANTQITWYVANNIANSNGADTGDNIAVNMGGGMLNGGSTALMVSITSSTNVLCNGQSTGSATALATGGTVPYAYHWSNGSSGATINNIAAGTYTVTVTDNASSTATANVTITQPLVLALTAPTISNVLCNGGSNGSITAHSSGGVSPYAFDWSTGASSATITNLSAGPYTVTVTDDNGCTKSSTYQITQPAVISINLVSLTNESCFNAEDGAITISVTGGVNPIFVEWSNGFLGTTITDLAADVYSVTVTDNNNCTKSASFTVEPGGIVNLTLNQQQNVTCPGGTTGSLSVTASGGVAPYTYQWSNGSTGSLITGLSAGSYIVTATDSHGCLLVKGYTITQPQPIDVVINQSAQNLCFGNSSAGLVSVITGGTSPYTASWSNGVNGNNNPNLPAGTYTVTITDNNACSSTKSATITDPPLVTVNVTTTDETGVGLNNGTATANPAGGTGAFTYAWNNGGSTAMITGLAPGTYTVTVSDVNSCSNSGSAQVDPFGCSLDITLPADFTICGENSAVVKSFVTGNSGTLNYIWSNGSAADSIIVTQSGEYCVTVMDEAGCQDMDCIVVTVSPLPTFDCFVVSESSPGVMDGSIQCNGTPANTYLWSTGATTPTITGLSPGVYCITIVNSNGCAGDTCFNVLSGNCQLSITSSQSNVLCSGGATGSITVIPNNTTPPISFVWSNGDTTAVSSNLSAGSYTVTVSDASGCFATDVFILTQPDPLAIMVDTIIPVEDFNSGAINVSISGGVLPYQYLWTFPDGSQLIGQEDLSALGQSGNYQLLVTDGNGCTILSANIFVPESVAVGPTPKYKSLKVYPVPTEDVLIIDMEHSITEVLISGVDGRLCKRFDHPSSNHLNVAELQAGWYFVRISDGTSWYVARFVK
ncbi:MAG: T9SS type A sorting domain-containing protein [Saprospiraceae bacterium]